MLNGCIFSCLSAVLGKESAINCSRSKKTEDGQTVGC